MNSLKILKNLANHPFNKNDKLGAIIRFFKWQINVRLNPYPIVYPFTENSKLLIWRGLTGATGNLYCGLHEFNDMGFLLHFLREDDLFVDIGANIGSYTILASAEIKAKTISIEPIPVTFMYLNNNILVNDCTSRVNSLNIGIGKEKNKIKFTKLLDTVNHVANETDKNTIDVEVNTLDNILTEKNPSLLKIDVEGFETEVIKGATNTLKNEHLKAIIIELNGLGKRYGFDENKVHTTLLDYGFIPYDYNPFYKTLVAKKTYGKFNTIYLRDLDFVNDRILNSRKIKIRDIAL